MAETTPTTRSDRLRSGEPQVFRHRWPWRRHEYRAMAVLALASLGIGLLGGSATIGVAALCWYVAGVVGAVGTVAWLWHVGTQRKDLSAVVVEVDDERIVVRSRGALQTTATRYREAIAVGYRRFGSDETFMVSDGRQAVRVPLRATGDPHVRKALDAAFACAPRIDDEARELYGRRPEVGATLR